MAESIQPVSLIQRRRRGVLPDRPFRGCELSAYLADLDIAVIRYCVHAATGEIADDVERPAADFIWVAMNFGAFAVDHGEFGHYETRQYDAFVVDLVEEAREVSLDVEG